MTLENATNRENCTEQGLDDHVDINDPSLDPRRYDTEEKEADGESSKDDAGGVGYLSNPETLRVCVNKLTITFCSALFLPGIS